MRFCLLTATPQRRQGHLLADPRKLVPFALQGGPLLTAACGILDSGDTRFVPRRLQYTKSPD